MKGPQEAALDSALLLKASSMGAQKARAMKSGSGNFDVDEFVSKLITYMGGRRTLEDQDPDDSDVEQDGDAPLDWERIGRKALAKSHRAPVPSFMQVNLPILTGIGDDKHMKVGSLISRTKETSHGQAFQA